MGRWFAHRGLATRLSLGVIALAIPLELLVLVTAVAGLEERRAAELENSVLVGQALAAVVNGFASDIQTTALATTLALGGQPGPLDQESAGPYLEAVARQYPVLRALFLTDPQGRTIATGTGGLLGFDLASRPYIRRLQAGAETVWSGGIAGAQTGETTVAYGRVVRGPDGVPRAYLIAALYPDQLVRGLSVELPPDARVTIVDASGATLYDSHPTSLPLDVSQSPVGQAALGGTLTRIVGPTVLFGGEARFGALIPVPRLGWFVAYTRPRAAVDAALTGQALVQAGGIALVGLVAAALTIAIARRLTAPLVMLADRAAAISRGEHPAIPDIDTTVELRQLATAMRIMNAAVEEREASLVDQREWLRVTLASIGDAVVATDADGLVSFMNEPAARLSGWRQDEALGQHVSAVLDLRNEVTRERVVNPIARVLAEGIVVGLANHTVLIARDGTVRPIDDSAAPIRDAEGRLRGVVMVFRDVGERRRAEQDRRMSEERLRLAVEAAPATLFNQDRELRYTWIGKPFPSLALPVALGETDAEIFPPAVADALTTLKRQAMTANTRVEGEIELPADLFEPETAPRTWALTVEPLRDPAGEIVGVTGAVVDITERRALERRQQEFISMVSHELRNPLASIKGYAQLMQRRGAYHERAVRSVVEQSDQLNRLISDLLDSSRLEAGRLELRRQRVGLSEVAAVAVERAQAQTEDHTIRVVAGTDPLLGFWDPARLEQVLMNLLSNAIKYSPDGGEIVVEVARQDHEAVVSVRDSGLGIDPEQLPRLFDRYYRARSTAERATGLGIGLYVARALVEAHGGRLWATSDGLGHGSTFAFALPLSGPSQPGGAPVLVVEDDEALRRLIAETLRSEGYRVLTATDGQDALEVMAVEPPALILLDWMMPRMDGAAFAGALRDREIGSGIPIVVMTAGGSAAERAASIGAAGFVAKPFDLALLLSQVERHVQREGAGPAAEGAPPS